MDVDVKTALVLGASGTLGGALARCLADDGYRLALHAFQHPERCPKIAGATTFSADFRDPDQIKNGTQRILEALGRIDVLVWAAGMVRDRVVCRLAPEEMREVLAVNLTAPFLWSKALARTFLKQRSGCVIFISSHAGFSGRLGGAAYASAQSGLVALGQSLAREWGGSGVRVNMLVPPFVADSEMGANASAQFVETVRERNVLKNEGDPLQGVVETARHIIAAETASGQVFFADARIVRA